MNATAWGGTVAVLVLVALVLGYLLLRRDPTTRRTRWGFFVERDRYQDDGTESRDLMSDETQEWPRRPNDDS